MRQPGRFFRSVVLGLWLCVCEAFGSGYFRSALADPLLSHGVVVAAEPDAVAAGIEILRQGGTAIDAAIAVQAVLGLEEPQSSGLGGGAFLLYYDAAHHKTLVYDGREVAPSQADVHLFDSQTGKPGRFEEMVVSGHAVGVPGVLAMLEAAHEAYGTKPWSQLFNRAAHLADQGFVVPKRLGQAIHDTNPAALTLDARRLFTKKDGQLYQAGELMTNPAYSKTLSEIAQKGAQVFYKGPLAQAILAKAHEPPLPSSLTIEDFRNYQPKIRLPLCKSYHGFKICTTPPPGGGMAVLETLGLLEHTDIARLGPKDPKAWLLFAQASRLAYADRDAYEGDPDYVKVPIEGLLDDRYLEARAKNMLTLGKAVPDPGRLPGVQAPSPNPALEPGGTSHFVIKDRFGNIVSMTTTIESSLGSGRVVGGFFLNNQLTDFSAFPPEAPSGAVDNAPNAPGPGKRPRSSMSPVLVFDDKDCLVAALGSPGGSHIIAYVAKTLVGLIDWHLSLQDAINLPNIIGRRDMIAIEKGTDPDLLTGFLAQNLLVKRDSGEISGLNGFAIRDSGLEIGSDSRREGSGKEF